LSTVEQCGLRAVRGRKVRCLGLSKNNDWSKKRTFLREGGQREEMDENGRGDNKLKDHSKNTRRSGRNSEEDIGGLAITTRLSK